MASKPTFRESLVCSPFNKLTLLLATECFIEFNTFVSLIIVVTFHRLFFGGRGVVVPHLDSRVMLALTQAS